MPGAGILGLALFLAGGLVVRTPARVPVPVPPAQIEQIQIEAITSEASADPKIEQTKEASIAHARPVFYAQEDEKFVFEGSGGVSLESLRLNQYRYPDQGAIGCFSELLTQRPAFFGEEERILGQSA